MNGFIREQVPYTDLEGWSTARIVSIAWRVLAPDGRMELQEHGYRIVRPVGFVIPADAVQIHGISTQRATQVRRRCPRRHHTASHEGARSDWGGACDAFRAPSASTLLRLN